MSRGAGTLVAALALIVSGPTLAGAAAVCADWIAVAVSVQGGVHTRRVGEPQWVRVRVNDTFCAGDMVRTDPRSRAAIGLHTGGLIRLDQNTTLTFSPRTTTDTSWIEMLRGAVHFVSRRVRSLNVLTPFINGAVEGTEFWIEVGADRATITVLEGRVTASNTAGSLTLTSGESALALAGQAPARRVLTVTPADAVQWALYYPPLVEYRGADFPDRVGETWPAEVRQSLAAYSRGDLDAAFAALAGVPETVTDARFFVHRAALLLSVGRVDEAVPDIDRALGLDPGSSHAIALRAIIAVTRNARAEALQLARQAVDLDPRSVTAHIALSYARQASFDLEGARASLQEAVRVSPDRALAHARLAELWLSFGSLDSALDAASEAVRLNPTLARTRTVLGFAALARVRVREAREAFESAIELDQTDPLPRLGLGLARIRAGELDEGRRDLEIAVSLDPGNSLLRSYLGKAYYEEKRDVLAADQFSIARKLDPRDPTPWFYDAVRKQSVNRPVEALQDLQRSIELNDNRAVYRSRLLLDEDFAARSVSLARIYDDLGFPQLALVESWKSVNTDPANHSAHRFLADSYLALPRHEIARVSELLQAQLLQPTGINLVQPQLGVARSFIPSGAGPADPAFNEFNALFERNRFSALVNGLVGSNDTYGDQVALAGVWNRLSLGFGQFHFESDGFRPNNDQEQNVYELLGQWRLSHATTLVGAFRSFEFDRGDLNLRFDPTNFSSTIRQEEHSDLIRLGLRHSLTPNAVILATAAYQYLSDQADVAPGFSIVVKDKAYTGELQSLLKLASLNLVAGVSHADIDRDRSVRFGNRETTVHSSIEHTVLYAYPRVVVLRDLSLTLGASLDRIDGTGPLDTIKLHPKLGVVWNPTPTTTLRGAAVRTLKRLLIADQTLEPTQVAGFNQFFDDVNATDAWRYGVALDQRLTERLFAGAEVSRRELSVPITSPADLSVERLDWRDDLARAYLYWTPLSWLALSGEYQYERLQRDAAARNEEQIARVWTHRVPIGVGFFHPSGFIFRVKATYVDQDGRFANPEGVVVPGSDRFVVVDASIGYRLPNRWGLVTIEAKNLLDQDVRFQDTDPANPTISPERLILARFTVAY